MFTLQSAHVQQFKQVTDDNAPRFIIAASIVSGDAP